MSFSCRDCRALLPGYIGRELTPKQRAQVSRHLNDCAACYAAYMRERQLAHELGVTLPRLGGAPGTALRAAVLAQVEHSAAPPRPRARLEHARFSVAALLLMMALVLPLTMQHPTFDVPTQPKPDVVEPSGTAIVAVSSHAVTLTATVQANYAPVLGATDTP